MRDTFHQEDFQLTQNFEKHAKKLKQLNEEAEVRVELEKVEEAM